MLLKLPINKSLPALKLSAGFLITLGFLTSGCLDPVKLGIRFTALGICFLKESFRLLDPVSISITILSTVPDIIFSSSPAD